MHCFPFYLSYEMKKEVKKEQGELGEGKKLAAGGPASLLALAGGREWKLGATTCAGTLIHSCKVSSCTFSPTQEAQHIKDIGRTWGYPLLGAAKMALTAPKNRT